jgi:hypothetical protein
MLPASLKIPGFLNGTTLRLPAALTRGRNFSRPESIELKVKKHYTDQKRREQAFVLRADFFLFQFELRSKVFAVRA